MNGSDIFVIGIILLAMVPTLVIGMAAQIHENQTKNQEKLDRIIGLLGDADANDRRGRHDHGR